MYKYETIKKLSSTKFRRLNGIRRNTFEKMVFVAKEDIKNWKSSNRGKPYVKGRELLIGIVSMLVKRAQKQH